MLLGIPGRALCCCMQGVQRELISAAGLMHCIWFAALAACQAMYAHASSCTILVKAGQVFKQHHFEQGACF